MSYANKYFQSDRIKINIFALLLSSYWTNSAQVKQSVFIVPVSPLIFTRIERTQYNIIVMH